MNEFVERHGKALFWLIGIIFPILVVIAQIMAGYISTPLNIFMLCWFGTGLFLYIGSYDEE